jgi:pimeloyl-ACP methyl ester carboxylesterase
MPDDGADMTAEHLAPWDLEPWGGVSRTVDMDGPVHYVDFGGPDDGPVVVMVHGLGGSHLNWCLLGPRLAGTARVLAVDLAGFGLTEALGRSTTVQANAALLGRFIRRVAGTPVVLVGNSMGGLVSLLHAARHPETVSGVVLIDPALPVVPGFHPDPLVTTTFFLYAVPRVGERFMERRRQTASPRELVMQVLKMCCVDPSRVPEELIQNSVALATRRAEMTGLDAAFLSAARSIMLFNANALRAWTATRRVSAPVLLMHGDKDRLVPVRSARVAARYNRDWRFEEILGVGHVPQLEAPDLVAEHILGWLEREHLIEPAVSDTAAT